jgi:hypothetical protein
MKMRNNSKALEAYKIFPYVAWILTLGFAFFVYHITTELKTVAESLQAQTQYLQEQINAAPAEQNFDKPVLQ